jgi:hypothetical protein
MDFRPRNAGRIDHCDYLHARARRAPASGLTRSSRLGGAAAAGRRRNFFLAESAANDGARAIGANDDDDDAVAAASAALDSNQLRGQRTKIEKSGVIGGP